MNRISPRTPRQAGFSMPAEWERHQQTWMEFPPANETFRRDLDRYRDAWAAVANVIAQFEPVCVVCNVGDVPAARRRLDSSITVHETAIDDAWVRDSGPTFLWHPDGRLGATHWQFNAWGNGGFSAFDAERHVGGFIADLVGAELFSSTMVNEGGGFHVDGVGGVLVTETVQLDPGRNPGWTAEQVEHELAEFLDVRRVTWIKRGLARDYDRFGTRGHIDMCATFCRPGVVLAHRQLDRTHPDHQVSTEFVEVLREVATVIEVPAPRATHAEGDIVDWSYINHYVCNGAVILCAFDDPHDQRAAEIIAAAYPGREVVLLDARPIFECGGGIHCITQQQPAVG